MLQLSRRRTTLALISGVLSLSLAASVQHGVADDSEQRAAARVAELVENGLVLLRDTSLSSHDRVVRFRTLFEQYFAVEAIGRWVLGRYWRQANAGQQQEYQKLFEQLITYGYVKRFGEYGGQSVIILGTSRLSDNTIAVNTSVTAPTGGQPVAVDWRVGARDGTYLITDVVVANVSLAQTWRSDFAASIQQQGGSIDAFLGVLRDRVAALRAEVEGR
jgi:phospholipid transport system substrate-binding protein